MEFIWRTSSRRTEIEFPECSHVKDLSSFLTKEWRNAFLVVDAGAGRLWDGFFQPGFLNASGLIVMEADENLKTTLTMSQIWDSMSSSGVNRDTPVVVIGGGLTCDMGAFAASTYNRGLKLMLIPTTMLCMVDACLGGKTGVNQSGAKNQIGTFHPARRIAIYPPFLKTLPEREFRSGLAEVIKTAVIGDRSIAKILERAMDAREPEEALAEIVRKCLAVKGSIVQSDLFDTGGRMVLNMGHTAGHALESASGFELTHGEAVGLGMLVEAAMASELGGKGSLPVEISELLRIAGLPCSISHGPSLDDIRDLMRYDKKTMTGGRIWALPFDWGDCRLTRLTPDEEGRILSRALDILRD